VDTIEHGSGMDGSAEEIAALVAAGTAIVPTLVVAENAWRMPELARQNNPELAPFPSLFRRAWIRSQAGGARAGGLGPVEIAERRTRQERLSDLVRRFHLAGGRVLAGSDAPALLVPPGAGLHRELELLVAAGLTPSQALACASAPPSRRRAPSGARRRSASSLRRRERT
jgi:imidazolonepropionase-like amidohydrolase